ncbi:hypothetical protein FHS43_005271 [Streptosporangium becharense]|uniref:Uncharacterized protein n=1 Tax=Streptosporangium becharense TaxID=1816182 RepID=A0A7W9IIJ8_9ACTN|nr:hypothetical protein [Streptosporangium becharense]MBB2913962.1 hypothetical protein [Streptosporangium becharense]MBB5821377.1 hypothetical protein [Streptosporangium becharense]
MIVNLALSAALVLTGAPTETATKTVSFRGFSIQVPATWKVDKDRVGNLYVNTGFCPKNAWRCAGFSIGGPSDIKTAYEGGPYRPSEPYHPSSDIGYCPLDKRYAIDLPPARPARTGGAPFGTGHKARFTEWPLRCMTVTGKATSLTYTQRIWHLSVEKVIVVDEWRTPGLAGILSKAVWR